MLDLPVTLVDEAIWLPGWVSVPEAEQDVIAAGRIARDEWALDSTYWRHRIEAMDRADLVICLDYLRLLSLGLLWLGRLVRRTATGIVTQEQRCNGNTESLRHALRHESILRWHFRSWRRKRDTMRAWHADPFEPAVVLLKRPRDADGLPHALRSVTNGRHRQRPDHPPPLVRISDRLRVEVMRASARFTLDYGPDLRFAGTDLPAPTRIRVPTRHDTARCLSSSIGRIPTARLLRCTSTCTGERS